MTFLALPTHTELDKLTSGVRTAINDRSDWTRTAALVADQLRANLPNPEILTPEQRAGTPDRAASHVLHVEPDGSFSIIAIVWRPRQMTPIHDHTTWCVFGVIEGAEHEDVYDVNLNLIESRDEVAGHVGGFAPPGDIHRVHNTSDQVAISIHIYGTDITRVGSSARRYYD
jgi:predicted metal-dependent enzyme (double-stranded beta helix superfamily)